MFWCRLPKIVQISPCLSKIQLVVAGTLFWDKVYISTNYNMLEAHDYTRKLGYHWQTVQCICANKFAYMTMKWSWTVIQQNIVVAVVVSRKSLPFVYTSIQAICDVFSNNCTLCYDITVFRKQPKWPSRSFEVIRNSAFREITVSCYSYYRFGDITASLINCKGFCIHIRSILTHTHNLWLWCIMLITPIILFITTPNKDVTWSLLLSYDRHNIHQ